MPITPGRTTPASHHLMHQTPRPKLLRNSWFQLAAAAISGLTLYATEFERHNLEVTHHDIKLLRLAKALDGLRIVHLTDFHYRHFAETSYLRRVVAKVNELAPDLVLLTGDYVSELTFGSCRRSAELSRPEADILDGIHCPHRFAILGNHDHMVGPKIIADALEARGFPVLQNRHLPFEHNGAGIWIAGVQSAVKGRPDLKAAVPAALQHGPDPVILLAHEPDYADAARAHGGIDLVLSGHSHGGQVRLPFLGAPKLPVMGRKYVQGLFALPGGTQLHVSRGIGAMTLPIRFLCRPEIAVLTLRSLQ